MPSPFLTPGATAEAGTLAILHLRRDQLMPTILSAHNEKDEGYVEGKVTNTRYGSFPHTTMIGRPWGSQILASNVDTGSRGRRLKQKVAQKEESPSLKRKAEEVESLEASEGSRSKPKAPATASSGFIHLLAPIPEAWTASLPHRTQVVYTPDYSYILHRIRARPGSTIIEAGAGSGSFTHASVRAVFNGYPSGETQRDRKLGKVCSFEYHEQRVEKIREEIQAHGMEALVEVNHRDVYNDGFLLGEPRTGRSPKANAVFLDLPAPWTALKHLVRQPEDGTESPLDPNATIHICTFSPCMEQVQNTVSALRQYGWINISMVEVQHRNIEVRRERYGAEGEGGRGSLPGPRNVEEAVSNLQAIEERAKAFHAAQAQASAASGTPREDGDIDMNMGTPKPEKSVKSEAGSEASVPLFKQGKVVHRWENELKTHTSYLVFAILPLSWTDRDEHNARQKWPSDVDNQTLVAGKSKKQMKREAKAARWAEKQKQTQQGQEQEQVQGESTSEKDENASKQS
ncbi:tRNA (adenine-N(1)-)-methyltransferase catalytic subunit trm61 [Ascosphaera pollenicola]|nr:tRNA (adenine-N(1)-)-methyltransferase catalytic subunit trm61 [Ascosphaera pollenicola]